jgi:hypothetical protein
MIEVLEHINKQEKTLQILHDAMARGGGGLITVPNRNRYRRRQEALNVREYSPSAFLTKLKKYFDHVRMLDASLMPNGDYETRESPLIAGVYRAR